MNNATKFIIAVLFIVALAFGFKAYKSGALDSVKAVPQEVQNPTPNE